MKEIVVTVLPDKSVLKSWTAWGFFLMAVGEAAERTGFLSPGLTQAVVNVVQPFGFLLAGLGLRRAPGVAGTSEG